MTLDESIDHIIKCSGLIPFFEKEKGEAGKNRLENLQELINAAAEYVVDEESELSPLQQFLDDAALGSGEGQADESQDCVQLMTLHTAKGLEFRFVFLVGMEENLFPNKMSLDETGRLEEERRLCYVGIPRAMHQLILTYAETRRLYGDEVRNTLSRFIRECPPHLIREVRMQPTISRPVTARSFVQQRNDSGLRLGQRVQHSIFGEGVILQFEGQGESSRVQVNFDSAGSKWLVLHFAKLEAL